MKTIRIALIGYGNVGKAFAEMLLRKEDYIREAFDAKAVITGICTKSRGVCLRPEGSTQRRLQTICSTRDLMLLQSSIPASMMS